ncbi:DUF1156 domain-containing protein [Arthrobacter sp. RHLT1-20]
MSITPKRKLIEVALPLEAINREAAREKSIRLGHPSTLHLWWSRKPLAAARAVLFAQLVDDPSSRTDLFPTEEEQSQERDRLHGIIERLVVWENVRDESLLAEARLEIMKSTGGRPPTILDPFAGGGAIPLEAQRLGLEAHASDLNPVAVLINKAMIEVPAKFRDKPPVGEGLADSRTIDWTGATGLATDVRFFGEWMRDEAERRIGHLYPKAALPDGTKATVIAWIWARTVMCPNPNCGIEMPLVQSWWLGKKKGKEAYIIPRVVTDSSHVSGRSVEFEIGHDPAGPASDGTMSSRQGATCVACKSAVSKDHIKAQGMAGLMSASLMAVVAEGKRRRIYLPPTSEHIKAAKLERPTDIPDQELGHDPRALWTPLYGLTRFSDLFSNRQLITLTTLSDLVMEARTLVLRSAIAAGFTSGSRLESGGMGAEAYADAVATYLGLIVSRLTDYQSTITTWASNPQMEILRNMFARQAIPMTWGFGEGNPFAESSGSLRKMTSAVAEAVSRLSGGTDSTASQADASTRNYANAVISTDPPYYDNIGYSDLSDFFYVWLRRSLRTVYPELLSTMLVPKAEELVANPYRHSGKVGAKNFFEDGFREVFAEARKSSNPDYPITVYYAFKQSDSSEDGTSSSGWETLLEGMIRSKWAITATWPMRTEGSARMLSIGTNALASSIVLALRPRAEDAPTTDRRGFLTALHAELPHALRVLQRGAIAPVDLPQAAIGPGMAVFSRYSSVIEADGSAMTVRSALARINEILDQVLNEQEGDFDSTTRFAIAWYRQHGYATGVFGVADGLARARNTSVETMARDEILMSAGGKVALLSPADLQGDYDAVNDPHTSIWETLHHLVRVLEVEGVSAAGRFLTTALSREDGAVDADLAKELAFLLFAIAEKNGWIKDAVSFNTLATSWPEILEASRSVQAKSTRQGAFDFEEVS